MLTEATLEELRSKMPTGTVKFFNADRGYGFVTPGTGDKDTFIHASALQRTGINELKEGDKISYEIETGRDGRPSATDVNLLR